MYTYALAHAHCFRAQIVLVAYRTVSARGRERQRSLRSVITSGSTVEGSWTRTWAGCVALAASRLWATPICSTGASSAYPQTCPRRTYFGTRAVPRTRPVFPRPSSSSPSASHVGPWRRPRRFAVAATSGRKRTRTADGRRPWSRPSLPFRREPVVVVVVAAAVMAVVVAAGAGAAVVVGAGWTRGSC